MTPEEFAAQSLEFMKNLAERSRNDHLGFIRNAISQSFSVVIRQTPKGVTVGRRREGEMLEYLGHGETLEEALADAAHWR